MSDRAMHILAVAILVGVSAAASGCDVVTDVFTIFQTEWVTEYVELPESGRPLEVSNRNGRVTVGPSADDQLHIRATKRSLWAEHLQDVKVVREEREDAYVIETKYARDGLRVSVDLDIAVPRGMKLSKVASSNGHLRVESVPGDVQAVTSNGSITLTNVTGFVAAETSNGSVDVRNCSGLDEIRSSNGNIYADIRDIRNDVRLRTSNGSIEALVHTAVEASVTLITSNGQVSAAHGGLEVHLEETTRLEGTVGEAAHELILKTSNGSITMQEFGR